MNQISDRLRGLVQSDIRRMSRECERVGGINLGQGICDLPTIPELVEGACDAIVANKATYSKFEGIDLLRERIARKLERYNGIAADPAKEIVVTVGSSGFSKTFSITGWRIGYAVADPRVAGPIGLMNDLFAICAPTPLQWGVARALEVPDDYYRNLAADYQKKRDILASALDAAGFRPSIPEGSYYMLASIPDEFEDDRAASQALLEEVRVASVPGSAFFVSPAGRRMLRFCFAKDFDSLEEACKRIREFHVGRVLQP